MATNDEYDKGSKHGYSARGYSAAYDADRPRAQQELRETMAGRARASNDDADVKNPDGEMQAPAPMPQGALAVQGGKAGPGPNEAGNSAGDGSIDPQGQQGGTEGGQPGTRATAMGNRLSGTPLADSADRDTRRPDEKGPRPILS